MIRLVRKTLKNQHGFTLVELMVVIAIIGILAIVALPRVQAALDSSRRAAAKESARGIQSGMEMYFIDWKSYPATGSIGNYNELYSVLGSYVNLPSQEKDTNFEFISYTPVQAGNSGKYKDYTMKIYALDSNATVITITPNSITP